MKAFLAAILALTLGSSCSRDETNQSIGSREKVIRISMSHDPQTLDPRQARDLISINAIHLIFDGLMRLGPDGKVEPALAETVETSPDAKKFTFKLKDTHWSNRDHLTAYDFERAWKSMLDPNFPSPNAYQLYVIKGAKAAKEGKAGLDKIGIQVIDPKTLVVETEQPTPYFLELAATHFFYPVNRNWVNKKADEVSSDPENVVGNGPYIPKSWFRRNELVLQKNPYYWNKDAVKDQKICLVVTDESTALRMLEKDQLDWAGSPLSTIPPDAMQTLKKEGKLEISPAMGIGWLRFNTLSKQIANRKIRKALTLVINRNELVQHILQGNQKSAMAIVPSSLWERPEAYFEDNDIASGWSHFQEALMELGISKDELHPLSLCYANGERNHKIAQALQQQWGKALGIKVVLEPCESQVFFDRLNQGNYDVSIGTWFADFRDPISFLSIFTSKDNGTNNTGWENENFKRLVSYSYRLNKPSIRKQTLKEAEKILMDELPIAPLFFFTFNHAKSYKLQKAYLTTLGWLDLKYAYLDDTLDIDKLP